MTEYKKARVAVALALFKATTLEDYIQVLHLQDVCIEMAPNDRVRCVARRRKAKVRAFVEKWHGPLEGVQ